MRAVETVLALVVVATIVTTFARRLSVPAPSLLVVAGVVIGLFPGVPAVSVSPDIISLVVLPPLLFAAGEELPLRDLRAVWRPVTVLAIGLVVVSAVAVGALTIALTPMPVGMAFVLGAVLASTDPVLETVLTLVTPYVGYVLAEAVGGSGVTAVVVASVVLGTQATRLTTASSRIQLGAVFETVVFLLESVVFGLIGLQLPALVRHLTSVDNRWPLYALAIAGTLIVVRLIWVFPLSAIVHRSDRRSWRFPAVVSWAGARGVVPLAVALSIPDALPYRDLVLLLTTAVIVTTLIVQGFTLAPLVRRAGIAMHPQDIRQEVTTARLHLAQAALLRLDQLADTESAPEYAIAQLRRSWQTRLERIRTDAAENLPDTPTAYVQLRRELLNTESATLTTLYDTGTITDTTRRRIQRTLDLEHTGLADE